MKLVVIESPYAADTDAGVAANLAYAHRCVLDCLKRGESPYASHIMLTTALNDRVPEERTMGIAAGLAWRRAAALRVFYVDFGWSGGMLKARALYDAEGLTFEVRRLNVVTAATGLA